MANIPKAALTFKTLKAESKIAFGQHVIASLTAAALQTNPFANLLITIAELQELTNSLSAATADMLNGGKAASAALKEATTAWNEGYTIASSGVSDAAKGVISVIVAGGFSPTKTTRTPKPIAGALTNYVVTPKAKKGAIAINAKKGSLNASGYVTVAMPDGIDIAFQQNTMVITVNGIKIYIAPHTTRENEIYDLPSVSVYNVTTCGFNGSGMGPASKAKVVPQ
jgi:hypothetical protein